MSMLNHESWIMIQNLYFLFLYKNFKETTELRFIRASPWGGSRRNHSSQGIWWPWYRKIKFHPHGTYAGLPASGSSFRGISSWNCCPFVKLSVQISLQFVNYDCIKLLVNVSLGTQNIWFVLISNSQPTCLCDEEWPKLLVTLGLFPCCPNDDFIWLAAHPCNAT